MILVIDLADDESAVARGVHAACTGPGFFYVANHGVAADVIDRTVEQARLFFRQPIEAKRLAAVDANHRGFNALGDALMHGARRPDHKEFFSIGLELPPDHPRVLAGEKLRGPNNWPPGRPAFRAAFSAYHAAVGASGGTLVVNVGDLLGRWTGGRYASTPHRVVNRSGRERFSIATFYDPDFQAVIDPRALGATHPRHKPTTAGAHILGRIERSFGYRASLAA